MNDTVERGGQVKAVSKVAETMPPNHDGASGRLNFATETRHSSAHSAQTQARHERRHEHRSQTVAGTIKDRPLPAILSASRRCRD